MDKFLSMNNKVYVSLLNTQLVFGTVSKHSASYWTGTPQNLMSRIMSVYNTVKTIVYLGRNDLLFPVTREIKLGDSTVHYGL